MQRVIKLNIHPTIAKKDSIHIFIYIFLTANVDDLFGEGRAFLFFYT
jgi:hypothetical protein